MPHKEYKDEDMEEEEEGGESLAYDPDQDREERLKVRKGYRSLQNDETLLNANNIDVEGLAAKVKRANALFDKVKGPQDATLDSAFLLTASNLTAAKARQMRADVGGFDIDDFVAKLVTYMGGSRAPGPSVKHNGDAEEDEEEEEQDFVQRPLDWDKIGRKALAKSRRVPVMDFMLGPLSVEVKKRAQKGPRTKFDKNAEEERKPQEINEEDIEKTGNETTKNVADMKKRLEELKGPINVFLLIVNPTSFGQTVENLFYLSFLIKDGLVSWEESEETAEVTVFLCNPPSDEDYDQGLKKKQMILELDQATWQRAIEVFEITTSFMPTREKAVTKIGEHTMHS